MRTTNTVSPLRQRMIEDMMARKLEPHSRRSHIHSCRRFAAFALPTASSGTEAAARVGKGAIDQCGTAPFFFYSRNAS
jgi:hypothetical protein